MPFAQLKGKDAEEGMMGFGMLGFGMLVLGFGGDWNIGVTCVCAVGVWGVHLSFGGVGRGSQSRRLARAGGAVAGCRCERRGRFLGCAYCHWTLMQGVCFVCCVCRRHVGKCA